VANWNAESTKAATHRHEINRIFTVTKGLAIAASDILTLEAGRKLRSWSGLMPDMNIG